MDAAEETLAVEAAFDGGGHAAKVVQTHIDKLKEEIARLRLTDEERDAVGRVAAFLLGLAESRVADKTKELLTQYSTSLRSLLERTEVRS